MNPVKYVAYGFMQDADKLLKDFARAETVEFKLFCNVWKKHNFSCIFMGRPDARELREFINEIYQLTLSYVISSSLEFQIGAIYLLYGLYRNQNIISPVKIRINQTQLQALIWIGSFAEQKNIRSLHYVIEYLCDNCLELVASPSLHGPCSSKTKLDCNKSNPNADGLFSDLKHNITAFTESNVLGDLKSLHKQYLKKKESFQPQKEKTGNVGTKYDNFSERLNALITGNKRQKPRNNNPGENIGNRRSLLKTSQFQRKAMFRYLNPDEYAAEEPPIKPPVRKRIRRKRIPAHKRKIGRPRKDRPVSEESDFNDVPIKTEVTSGVIPKRRGPIGRKKVSYLKDYEGPALLNVTKQETESMDESDTSEESSGDIRF